MPARLPFARRPAAVVPGAERAPASVVGAEVSPQRHAGRWTVGPGDQDDEWFHRLRRHRLARADGPTTLNRPAIYAGPAAILRSPGQPPDQATRALMEPSLGHDFSRVRVHTDDAAAAGPRERPQPREVTLL